MKINNFQENVQWRNTLLTIWGGNCDKSIFLYMPKAYSNGEGGRGIEGGRGKIAPHFFPNLQFFPYQNDSLNPAPWPPPHAHTSWHTIPCWAIQSKYLCDLGQGKVFVSIKKETKTLSVVPAPWQIYPNSTVYKLFQGNDEQSDIRRNDLGSVRNSTFPSNNSPLVSWELEFGVEGWSAEAFVKMHMQNQNN